MGSNDTKEEHMHLSKQWRIWAVLALVPALALMGCEGTTGEGDGDAMGSGDVMTGDTATSDTSTPPVKKYRYILIQEGPNKSIEECKAGDDTPGADIDAVALFRGTDAIGYCQSIEWRKGVDRGTVFCADKDPTEANAAAATGAPDACTQEYATPECPNLKAEFWIWLNGGEIVCDLGEDGDIMKDDNIVVYEVFNPAKADSIEAVHISVANDAAGPWIKLTGDEGAVGIAPLTVPEL